MRRTIGLVMAAVFLLGAHKTVAAECPQFLAGHKVGTVELSAIREASGLAASRKNSGVLWVHNDGGPPCVYAMTIQGAHLGMCTLKGARVRNWEDIAIGPGPDPNIDYLYVGDIGDNRAKRKSVVVYRVPEPAVDANQSPVSMVLDNVAAIELQYPAGPRDAETLLLDPLTKDLYIISKETATKVYRAAYPQTTNEPILLELVATIPWGTATGGDISPNGSLLIIRSYFAASLWVREKGTSVKDALAGHECSIPLILERQGEAVCFDANGTGYFTTSEGARQPIYYFPRKPR